MVRVLMVLSAGLFALPLFAQQEQMNILRKQTEERLSEATKNRRCVLGYMALDLNTREKLASNESLVFPQASAIKIPLLMEVFKQAHEGKFKFSDTRTIDHAGAVEGGVLYHFASGQSRISIYDLCVLMIVLSDNSATNILIDLVGMENVNKTMQSLGLAHTRLQRKMMDVQASARGDENISTPAEACRVMQLLAAGEFIDRATSYAILDILRIPRDVPGIVASTIPSDVAIAYKKGEILPAVQTEWALVELKGHPYVLAVMANYGLDTDAAVAFQEISKGVYDYFWRLAGATPHGTYNDPSLWK